VGNQAPAAGGIISVKGSGGSGSAKLVHKGDKKDGKKGGMLYAKQDGAKKRSFGGTPGRGGQKKGPKKQKK